jgi:hypothetical protein
VVFNCTPVKRSTGIAGKDSSCTSEFGQKLRFASTASLLQRSEVALVALVEDTSTDESGESLFSSEMIIILGYVFLSVVAALAPLLLFTPQADTRQAQRSREIWQLRFSVCYGFSSKMAAKRSQRRTDAGELGHTVTG